MLAPARAQWPWLVQVGCPALVNLSYFRKENRPELTAG